jgi:proteasome accessory factor C
VSAGAVGQLTRLLALIPWLIQRPGVTIDEAAAEFEVSPDQLRADLELAFLCGLPGHLPDDLIDVSLDGDRIVVSNADTIARPLRLAPDEAVALLTGLRALADIPTPTGPDVLERVIAKLERAAGDAADAHRSVRVAIEGGGESTDPARAAIAEGLHAQRRLTLHYYVPARDEITVRDVDPVRLLVVDGHGYLEGWCLSADDWRLFRLDRVHEVHVTATPAQTHPAPAPRQAVFDSEAAPWRVRLALEERAAWLVEAYQATVVQHEPELVVELPVADLGWARQLVLRLGRDVRPLAPAELVSDVHREARAALEAYAEH